ncbi:unnamed protein product, partial [Trichobilharzia regenti]
MKSSISITLGAPSDEDMKKAYDRSNEIDKELASFESNYNEENVLKEQINELNRKIQLLNEKMHNIEPEICTIKCMDDELAKSVKDVEVELKESELKLAEVRAKVKEQDDAGYGKLRQEYRVLCERFEARTRVKEELTKELEQKQLDYTRLEGVIAPTLDDYNHVCTYRKGFDVTKEIPRLIEAVTHCIDQFNMIISAKEEKVQHMIDEIKTLEASINKSHLPDLQAKLIEVKNELTKLDELLTEIDNSDEKSEEEFIKRCNEKHERLEDLKKQICEEEKRKTELN